MIINELREFDGLVKILNNLIQTESNSPLKYQLYEYIESTITVLNKMLYHKTLVLKEGKYSRDWLHDVKKKIVQLELLDISKMRLCISTEYNIPNEYIDEFNGFELGVGSSTFTVHSVKDILDE